MFLIPLLFKVLAKVVSNLFDFLGGSGPIDAAFISNTRDKTDRLRIGNPKDFVPWTVYFWRGIKGQLFMISSMTEEIGGATATPGSIKLACKRFEKAVDEAVARGARVILYAAGTKRLPIWQKLREKYPDVIFTLGDNFTGILLQSNIKQAIDCAKLEKARILLIAPYGLLGRASVLGLANSGHDEVIIMGNPDIPERQADLQKLAEEFGFIIADSFELVGKVDVVVTCNCGPWAELTPERIALIRRPKRKLIVVDPCEPANLKRRVFAKVFDRVIRFDSGNGYSKDLKYVLGPIAAWINQMAEYHIWGCFAEAMIIAKHLPEHPEWREIDWYEVEPFKLKIMEEFVGSDFEVPAPTNYNQPVYNFRVDIVEPSLAEIDHDV